MALLGAALCAFWGDPHLVALCIVCVGVLLGVSIPLCAVGEAALALLMDGWTGLRTLLGWRDLLALSLTCVSAGVLVGDPVASALVLAQGWPPTAAYWGGVAAALALGCPVYLYALVLRLWLPPDAWPCALSAGC